MVAFFMVVIMVKALFGLASHVVSMRVNIDQRLKKQLKVAHQQHNAIEFKFIQQQVPKGQTSFTALVISPGPIGGVL
jgi:hypothetical protein